VNSAAADPKLRAEQATQVDAVDVPVACTTGEPARGTRIGQFVVQRKLGEGGMGVVYLAEQIEPVARTVALKLIRQQLRGGLTEAWFQIERQMLARMNHPAIATVYEAGTTPQGFLYFAMQFIDGVALDVWHARQPPDLKSRLRLLIAIARGVQHAHQRGIIHRDLKPSNVLVEVVDGRAQPKIIDFGIALSVEAQPQNVVAGSGVFMSPEQARADLAGIDIRSDVYALGMLMLVLLLPPGGFTPLVDELCAHGRSVHAGIARSLGRARIERRKLLPALAEIPWELRWVLVRALAPDREQRYESAQALADELERFLVARPLLAVPSTRRYRTARFVRRHRLPLSAGLAVLLSLLGGLGAAIYALREAEAEAQKSGTLAAFLSEVIAGVDPDRAQGMDKALMRMVLDSAATRAQARLARQPAILSAVESVIGKSYDGLGEADKAIDFHRSAYERVRARLGPRDRDTLSMGRVYARTLANHSRTADAHALIEILHADAQAELGAADAETLRIEATRGWIQRELGHLQEARALLEQTLATQTAKFGARDDDVLDTSYGLAIVLSDLGEGALAEPIYRRLIHAHRLRDGAEHPKVLGLSNSLGALYLDLKRFAEAEKLFSELLPTYVRVLGPTHAETLGVIGNQASALTGLKRHAEAGVLIQQVVDGFEASAGPTHPWTLYAWSQLGSHRLVMGDAAGALSAQEHARTGALEAVGAEHPLTLMARAGWAAAATALGRFDEASQEYQAVLVAARKIYPENHSYVLELQQNLDKTRALRAAAEKQ
jgi:non-specific serine/threonine protein kinase/serine/threonine-protein kinase